MKILLIESQIPNAMKIFIRERFPTLLEPLSINKHKRRANSGWGSSMHDYIQITTDYVDDEGNIWVREFDDRDKSADSKYTLDERLEIVYSFFGEELFEEFFKKEHNIDLKNKGKFVVNWYFH